MTRLICLVSGSMKEGTNRRPSAENNICYMCDKTFSSPFNLKRHLALHTGDKPWKCSECGKCFTQKANLKAHTIVHYKLL